MAIHPAGIETVGKVITGSRKNAELQAHLLINKWLDKAPRAQALKVHRNSNRHYPFVGHRGRTPVARILQFIRTQRAFDPETRRRASFAGGFL